jgi:hypothetical protein
MKVKFLLLLSLLLTTFVTKGSHILGGMLVVGQTSQDSTAIAMNLVMDPQGIVPPKQYVAQYEMVNGSYDYVGSIELYNPITLQHQGMYLVIYTSDYLDLDSNKYRFVANHCCWGPVTNSSGSMSSNFIISADYWHIPNNSTPFMENPLWINMQVNSLNTMKPVWGNFNCFFSQMDNDSVNIEMDDLLSNYSTTGSFVPQTTFNQLTNYSVSNDSISWTPNTLGRYATGFKITEYRNGQIIGEQRIQWSFYVLNSTIGIDENIVNRNMEYKVYPNPSKDFITVDNDGIIYNTLGVKVMEVKKGVNNISSLPKGIYYISKTKFIKQ